MKNFLFRKMRSSYVHYFRNNSMKPFQDLAPFHEVDDFYYMNVLDKAINNERVRNIAITAPYGAGKSSLLRSFEHNYPLHKYLNISLATFEDKENSDELNHSIEKSILQQMIYKIKGSKIPKSRFKRIVATKYISWIALLFFIWIIAAIIVLYPNELVPLYPPNDFQIPAFLLFSIGIYIGIRQIMKTIGNVKLHKISLQSPEIEIGDTSEVSILNKHFDEILYFFEVTDFDVVIIEDLDRFQKVEIFTKLRELNALINNSDQIGRRVVFLYAIRDNVFQEKMNRTKFFDFILPIIPIINSSNAHDMFIRLLKEADLEKNINEAFIRDVSLYISDMRMLKNICNEFLVYKEKIGNIKVNMEHLMAMVIYKNVYPDDFAKLHENDGLLFQAFSEKGNEIKKLIYKLDSEIFDKQTYIERMEEQTHESLFELIKVYLYHFACHNIETVSTETGWKRLEELVDIEVFDHLSETDSFKYQSNNSNYTRNYNFSNIEKEVDPEVTYKERKQLLEMRLQKQIDKEKQAIEQLQIRKRKLKSKRLVSLMEEYGTEDTLNENIREEKLLVYFLRHGYITEEYHALISYFYPETLSYNDKVFVMSVKNHEELFDDYLLENPDKVLREFSILEFEQKEILNFSLLIFLLKNSGKYSEYLKLFLNQLADESEKSFDFVRNYLQYETDVRPKLVQMLYTRWQNMWNFIQNDSRVSDAGKEVFLKLIIMYVDIRQIHQHEKQTGFARYIENMEHFLSTLDSDEYKEKAIRVIGDFDIRFKKLLPPQSKLEEATLDFIVKNNYYQINRDMLELIMLPEHISSFYERNYTTILKSKMSEVQKYIADNMKVYAENVLLVLPETKTTENEEAILKILNSDTLSPEIKKEILKKQIPLLDDLDKIHEDNWHMVFETKHIEPDWKQVIKYYSFAKGMNENLTNYLNDASHYLVLLKSPQQKVFQDNKDASTKLFLDLLKAEAIHTDTFSKLSSLFDYTFENFDLENIFMEKVFTLIDEDKIYPSIENYVFLRDNYDRLHIPFLERQMDELIETICRDNFDENDLLEIMQSNKVFIEKKADLLQIFKPGSEDITLKMLPKIALLVKEIVSQTSVPFGWFKTVLNFTKYTDEKIAMITKYIEFLNDDEIREILDSLGSPYTEIIKSGKRPDIKNTSQNIALLKSLKSRNIVTSYKIDGEKLIYYRPRNNNQ